MKLEVNKLGRPYHKIPKIISDCFDIFDTQLSFYFLKKYRVNVALKDITFQMDCNHKQAHVFATQSGHVAFDIDRILLLNILSDYYGLSKENNATLLDLAVPVTKTEERLKNKLGLELTQLILHQEDFGAPLEIKNDYSTVIKQWSYRVTFLLKGYVEGCFSIFLDNHHVDRVLATLRDPNKENVRVSKTLSPAQRENLVNKLPVRLNCRLACANLTLAQLMNFKKGDIIPISSLDRFPLFIGKEQIFSTVTAEDRGKLFFSEFNNKTNEINHV